MPLPPHPQGLDRYQLSHPLVSSVLFLSPHPHPHDNTPTSTDTNTNTNSSPHAGTINRDVAAHPYLRPHGAPTTHDLQQQQGHQLEAPVWLGGPTLVLDQSPAGCCCPDCVALTHGPPQPPGGPAEAAAQAPGVAGPEALPALVGQPIERHGQRQGPQQLARVQDGGQEDEAGLLRARAPLAHRAWSVWPGRARGRLLLFPGNRLHGVLPGPVEEGEGGRAAGVAHTAEEMGLRGGGVAGECRRGGGSSCDGRELGAGGEGDGEGEGGCGGGGDGPPPLKREWGAAGILAFRAAAQGVGVCIRIKFPFA